MLDSVQGFILSILALLVIIIFGGSIYAFFYAIVLFIFSSGDTDKIKKAWNSIRFMILGVFLTLIFLFVFPILFKRIEVPGYQAYTAQNIFNHASYLVRSIISFGSEAVQNYEIPGSNAVSTPESVVSPGSNTPPPSQSPGQLEL